MIINRVGIILNHTETGKYLCVFQNESNLWGFPKGRLDKNDPSMISHNVFFALRKIQLKISIVLNYKSISTFDSILTKRNGIFCNHSFF